MNLDEPGDKEVKWYLRKMSDGGATWTVPIEPLPFCIGRGKDCDLSLRSKWVSRRHAQIHSSGGILWLHDLGSTNGTLLNQKRVQEAEVLEVGDHLYFGDYEFFIRKKSINQSVLSDETVLFDPLEEQTGLSIFKPHMEKLLHTRNVIPHFQPIVSLPDETVLGYEILGRISEEGLPENVEELFDIADQFGYACDLSFLLREAGIRQGASVLGETELFVNTHPSELSQMHKLEQSIDTLRQEYPTQTIVLEINEKTVTHLEQMIRLRAMLTDYDLKLAYDDFGVGQTRLVELAKLPPDYLKFDISLIRNIHIAPKRLHQILLTFIKASHDLGIKTLAEGIECREESEVCTQLGFEYAQGYYYGRPVSITDLST